jgi:hypothetical protein
MNYLLVLPHLFFLSASFVGLVRPLSAGVSPHEVKAFNELKASAESGSLVAQFKVGLAYFNGDGVAEDVLEGAKWYRRAAEKGNADAQWNLALAYYGESGLEESDKRLRNSLDIGIYEGARQAAKWWLMAAEQGHAQSQYRLAFLYYIELRNSPDYKDHPLFSADERPKYFSLASKFALKAAAQGHVKAQNLMGLIYDDGMAFGARKPEDAFVWYSVAASAGDGYSKSKADKLELMLDTAAISRGKERILSIKAEIESNKAGK